MTSPIDQGEALAALAARVEAATGPSREMDRAIASAIGWHPAGVDPNLMKTDAAWLYLGSAPAYTRSLDAVISLVPEGWAYRVDWRPDSLDLPRGADPEPGMGMVYRGIGRACFGKHGMAALALCAAALRALREHIHTNMEGER